MAEYYQKSYSHDYPAHQPPSQSALAKLLRTGFVADPEKNFTRYIEVLKAVGLKSGDAVLDFGCSWGFGSWQFRQAGFNVYSLEVSQPRADYARSNLNCRVVSDVSQIPERIQCVFSSHVIEHLPDPTLIWDAAEKILGEDGKMVIFCPNGEPAREALIGRRQYGYLWPQVHPMVITPKFMRSVSRARGFSACCFSTPYDLAAIANSTEPPHLIGEELCLVARRERRNLP